MSQDDQKAEVTRRSLIRRAGTVAAGVGAAGIASAAIASPAQATDGQPVIQGAVNTGGNTTTTIKNTSVDKAALTLSNDDGAPLALDVTSSPTFSVPVGSVFADDFGSLYSVGDKIETPEGTEQIPRFVGVLTPAFSTSTSFVAPERWLVTFPGFVMPNGAGGRDFVVPGSANYDGTGRVLPKGDDELPDLTLDFSPWFYEFGILGVQGTLLVLQPVGDGFVSLYDTPVWPGTSSMNFQSGQLRDGFTQMAFTAEGTVNFKVSKPAVLVFDIFAFVVGNGTGRIFQPEDARSNSRAAISGRPSKMPKDMMPRVKGR